MKAAHGRSFTAQPLASVICHLSSALASQRQSGGLSSNHQFFVCRDNKTRQEYLQKAPALTTWFIWIDLWTVGRTLLLQHSQLTYPQVFYVKLVDLEMA